jgi:hypothetical protein
MTAIVIEDMGETGNLEIRRHVFDRVQQLTDKTIAKMLCVIRFGDNYDEEEIELMMSSFGEDGNPPVSFSTDKQSATWFDNAETEVRYTFVLV